MQFQIHMNCTTDRHVEILRAKKNNSSCRNSSVLAKDEMVARKQKYKRRNKCIDNNLFATELKVWSIIKALNLVFSIHASRLNTIYLSSYSQGFANFFLFIMLSKEI